MAEYAPGMRVIIRDEEWMIKKSDINSFGNYTLQCIGISPLVKDKPAYFLSDLEKIEVVDPAQTKIILADEDTALSLMYALIRGTCSCLNIEEDDIAGCLQYYYNNDLRRSDWAIILYDRTPGGAGHVRRLYDRDVLSNVFRYTMQLLENCTCGGDDKDSSCYTCLRNYYNQKYHDRLSRGKAISYLQEVFGEL